MFEAKAGMPPREVERLDLPKEMAIYEFRGTGDHPDRLGRQGAGAATQEIARNVQHACQGAHEVTSNIVGVSRAASDSSATSSQALSSATEFARQAARLRQEVATFLHTIRAA